MEPTRRPRVADVQASAPAIPVSLSRVGVTNVEKVARIGPRGADQLYYVKLDCFVALGPEQKGAHMSRFEEVVNDVIGEVVLGGRLQGRAARSANRRRRSRAPGRGARGGDDRRSLSGVQTG